MAVMALVDRAALCSRESSAEQWLVGFGIAGRFREGSEAETRPSWRSSHGAGLGAERTGSASKPRASDREGRETNAWRRPAHGMRTCHERCTCARRGHDQRSSRTVAPGCLDTLTAADRFALARREVAPCQKRSDRRGGDKPRGPWLHGRAGKTPGAVGLGVYL